MTPAQYELLNDAILADQDPAVVAALAAQSDTTIANLYNAVSAKIVWRTRVSLDEIMQNGFDWVQVDNLTVGKARIWEWLFDNAESAINPSKPNVRAAISECWKGTAEKLAVQAAVFVHCKRFASKAEAIFATGVGTDADPANMVFEGEISPVDVAIALRDDFGNPKP